MQSFRIHATAIAVDYAEATFNGNSEQWWSGIAILTVKLQAIRRLCNKLLVIMLNCWRVNESWTVDIT